MKNFVMLILAAGISFSSFGCVELQSLVDNREKIASLNEKIGEIEKEYTAGKISGAEMIEQVTEVKGELSELATKGGALSVLALVILRFRHYIIGYYDEKDKTYKGALAIVFKIAKKFIGI